MPTIKLGWEEDWERFWSEGYSLFLEELEEYSSWVLRDQKFEWDEGLLGDQFRARVFRPATARVNGKISAYCCWTVHLDPEAKGVLIAKQGPWFAPQRLRRLGLGVELFNWCKSELELRGIRRLYLHHPVYGRGKRLDSLFTRLGATPTNIEYILPIGAM